MSATVRQAVYRAVRFGGSTAWESNQRERTDGLPRIIPQADMEIPALALWPSFRKELVTRGVRPEPKPSPTSAYCGAVMTSVALKFPLASGTAGKSSYGSVCFRDECERPVKTDLVASYLSDVLIFKPIAFTTALLRAAPL